MFLKVYVITWSVISTGLTGLTGCDELIMGGVIGLTGFGKRLSRLIGVTEQTGLFAMVYLTGLTGFIGQLTTICSTRLTSFFNVVGLLIIASSCSIRFL